MREKILLISLLFVSSYAMGQFQFGQTLFEWYSSVYYESGVDVSNDGSVFVLNNPKGMELKVFEFTGVQWKQKGQTLSRIKALTAVIADDGNTVVANESYRIHVFKWDGNTWVESVSPEFFGQGGRIGNISVSNSGNRISISYIDRSAFINMVQVVEWRDFQWQSLGDKIISSTPSLYLKPEIAKLSGDGSSLVLCNDNRSRLPNPYGGIADVYRYSGTEWVKLGESIMDSLTNFVGVDASISNDGDVIVTAGWGQIKAHHWNGLIWETKGAPIFVDDFHRCIVELDGSGNRIAFSENIYSSSLSDREGYNLGRIAIMEFGGQNWGSIGLPIQGEQAFDQFGTSIGFSGDGEVIIAVSNPVSDTRMSYIKAFKYDGVPFSPISFISGSSDDCDYERVAHRSQFNIEFSDGQTYHYYLDSSSTFMLPIWDSIIISPKVPPNYRAVPPVSILDSITLEAYKAIPGTYIRDSFCLIPLDESIADVRIDIIIPQSARPGLSFPVLLKYTNVGTKTVSGNVEFYFDGQLQEITSTNPTHDVLGANHVRWNYEDLLPLESRDIELSFELNRPTDDPPLNGGERLLYSAKVEPVDGDVNPYDNRTEANIEVVNSFDPNDKRCMQGDTIGPESVGGALTYVIRFENLGTAEAIDVRIRDIIDTNVLDISTFEMMDASHDGYMVQISEGNIIDFIFRGINLPFDDASNDGYVAFNMHTKMNLQLGDRVKNDAAIYFDFNPPVITNEMITLVADQPTSIATHNPQLELSVYPNPSSDMARVNANTGILRIDLIDIQGRQLRQELYLKGVDKTRELSVTGLSKGNYWLRVTTDEGVGTIPLVVK